mgnify:CR=1 FL=1
MADQEKVLEVLVRLETKLDVLLMQQGVERGERDVADPVEERSGQESPIAVLGQFTTKQHAALQMIVSGASNAKIARRFNVTENTAKVYVRMIAKKLGVPRRPMIVAKTLGPLRAVSDQDYAAMTGGLPKDWDETYEEPDVYANLYRHED